MDDARAPGGDGVRRSRPALSIAVHHAGSRSIVTLTGELDLAAVDAFSTALREVRAAGSKRVEVDAGELTFVDSAGLQALLVARRVTVAGGGAFTLVHVSPALRRMLALSGLADVFTDPDVE